MELFPYAVSRILAALWVSGDQDVALSAWSARLPACTSFRLHNHSAMVSSSSAFNSSCAVSPGGHQPVILRSSQISLSAGVACGKSLIHGRPQSHHGSKVLVSSWRTTLPTLCVMSRTPSPHLIHSSFTHPSLIHPCPLLSLRQNSVMWGIPSNEKLADSTIFSRRTAPFFSLHDGQRLDA